MEKGEIEKIKPVKELDFKVIREDWWKIKLKDGSTLKMKPVLIRCFETNKKDPSTGKPAYAFKSENVTGTKSPDDLKGEPSPTLPSPSEALKMDKKKVEVVDVEEPRGEHHKGWNIYELETGKKVKAKLVVANVYRIKDKYDNLGDPFYVVQSHTVWGSNPLAPPLQLQGSGSVASEGSGSSYYRSSPGEIPRLSDINLVKGELGYSLPSRYYQILEEEVCEILNRKPLLSLVLDGYIDEIKEYLDQKDKVHKLGVTLRRDPEDPEFWVILIVINTRYKNLDEKLELMSELGEVLDEKTETLSKRYGEEALDAGTQITFRVEGGEYES